MKEERQNVWGRSACVERPRMLKNEPRGYSTVKGMIMPRAACGAPVAGSGTKQMRK